MILRFRGTCRLLIAVAALSACACGARNGGSDDRAGAKEPAADRTPLPEVAGATGPRIVVLGDSLTAGLGLPIAQSFPSRLQQRLEEDGFKYTIVNAGTSGDTSAGGLSRLDWALSGDVRILIVALGGNDGLRGLPVESLSRNLSEIVERAQARGIAVVIAGMEAPPNYGVDYTLNFHKVYPALAKQYHLAFVPFLLDHVAGITALNQDDGIHPTAEGAQIVADNVWRVLKPVVEDDVRRASRDKAPAQ